MPCCNTGRAICGPGGAAPYQRTKGQRSYHFCSPTFCEFTQWIMFHFYASQKLPEKTDFWKTKNSSFIKKKKNLFHISKAFISAFTILYALLCLVLKSYKTKISFFYNSWHVMFLALEFSLDKESDYTVQFYWSRESFIFLWNLRV